MNPWDNEPDEATFVAHGLKCAMVRTSMKHWCGYVAIPEGHPWFGLNYSDTVTVPDEIINRPIDVDKVGAINLLCAAFKEHANDNEIDIVCAIDVHGGLTYAADHCPKREPNGDWWFGFDCAHAGDLVPGYSDIGLGMLGGGDVYRDEVFVRAECERLAEQLGAMQ